uniref:Uncharacterized protein n=1 Tax=Myoviridae sp. ctiBE32 TaxID=2826685 RepID=A0A8S5N7N3_9CAUD|nr:MAG TPA: hypothetical protein [Myoviridae sp. ctiBE32]
MEQCPRLIWQPLWEMKVPVVAAAVCGSLHC